MSQTEKFIRKLEALKEGERSRLRKLAGKPPNEAPQGFDLFTGIWWPLRERNPRAPERRSAWLVAKLYGAFPLPDVRHEENQLARLLGRCERAMPNHFDRERFRLRFDTLLQSPLPSLEPHLGWALFVLDKAVGRKSVAGLDWVRLLDDLRLWVTGADRQDGDRKRRERDISRYLGRGLLECCSPIRKEELTMLIEIHMIQKP